VGVAWGWFFSPRIVKEADGAASALAFVAAGFGEAVVSEPLQKIPDKDVGESRPWQQSFKFTVKPISQIIALTYGYRLPAKTCFPHRLSNWAMARPIPDEAPVTKTVRTR
jgi:hypothetical protein